MLLLVTSACGVLTHREEITEHPAPDSAAAEVTASPETHEADDTTQDSASLAAQEGTPASPAPEVQLVQYANAWISLSREAQRQEFLESEARYLKSGEASDLIHHAMLSVLRTPERAGTTKRVRGDLRRYLESAAEGPGEAPTGTDQGTVKDEFVPIARILLYLLDEREQTISQLTAQNETLQRQLDELKAIEEQLRDRTGSEPIQATPR